MKTVVIGAGIVGASCAYHLARAGAEVAVVERGNNPGQGSTGRSAAGIRHQFSLEENVRFSLYSSAALRRFDSEVGGDAGYRQVGYLFLLSDAQRAAWHVQQEMQRALGASVRSLDPSAVAERFPFLSLDGVAEASFGPEDGVLDPHGITTGYLSAARRLGATLHLETEVTAIARHSGGWHLSCSGDTRVRADAIVNAAGAWSASIGALVGIELPIVPLRRCVYLTGPLPQLRHPTPLIIDAASGVYLRSEGDRVLFGLSNPDQRPGFELGVDWDWLDTVLERALPRFPFLNEATLDRNGCWAGLYAVTPDHLPILGRTPACEGFLNACGFSGHGVQHAPATGLALAEEALRGEASSFDLTRFRLERFGTPQQRSERAIV